MNTHAELLKALLEVMLKAFQGDEAVFLHVLNPERSGWLIRVEYHEFLPTEGSGKESDA